MMCITLRQLLLMAIVALTIKCNVEAKFVKLENYSDTFGLRKSALNQQKKQIETANSNLSPSRPSSDSISSASELQNLMLSMSMPSGRRRFDDVVAPSASIIETSRHQSLSPAINGLNTNSRQLSEGLSGIELRQKLLAADMLLNSNIGRQFEQQLKSTTNNRFNQHLAQSNSQVHLQKKRSSSQQQELPIQSSDDKEDNLNELDSDDENVDDDDDSGEERKGNKNKAQSRSSNDGQDDDDNENDSNDEFSEPQARISTDTFFQDNDASVNAKLNSRSSYDDNDNDNDDDEITDTNNNKMLQRQTNKNNLNKQQTKKSKSPKVAHSSEINSNKQNSLDDETADRDSNYDASNISLNKTELTSKRGQSISNQALGETFAASQAQVNKAGVSEGADLTAAAGHHHHHGHSHYYQYAEVPKKKAWKFGFKRGNHKHEISRHEKGYKHKFHSEFHWHAKEKCKKKKKCKSIGSMKWEYKHAKKHHKH